MNGATLRRREYVVRGVLNHRGDPESATTERLYPRTNQLVEDKTTTRYGRVETGDLDRKVAVKAAADQASPKEQRLSVHRQRADEPLANCAPFGAEFGVKLSAEYCGERPPRPVRSLEVEERRHGHLGMPVGNGPVNGPGILGIATGLDNEVDDLRVIKI